MRRCWLHCRVRYSRQRNVEINGCSLVVHRIQSDVRESVRGDICANQGESKMRKALPPVVKPHPPGGARLAAEWLRGGVDRVEADECPALVSSGTGATQRLRRLQSSFRAIASVAIEKVQRAWCWFLINSNWNRYVKLRYAPRLSLAGALLR
jgi:hypothetical protein